MRIEELSRRSDVSVRNIREYQDRGLLPAPARQGRTAVYDDDHLVRLRLISRLLTRGYTLAVIRDLLDAWAAGRDLRDVLGLETAASRPWGDDEPATLTRAEVEQLFRGPLTDAELDDLAASGLVIRRGDQFRCTRRRFLDIVPDLLDAGIPNSASTATLGRARGHLDAVAEDMVALVVAALLPEGVPQGLPSGEDLARATATIERLRGVADVVAGSLFGLAMQQAVEHAVALVTDRALRDQVGRDVSSAPRETRDPREPPEPTEPELDGSGAGARAWRPAAGMT